PAHLVDHLADRVRKVLRPRAIQSDLRHGILAFQRLAAGFEVDVLGETLQIIRPLKRTLSLPLLGLNVRGLDACRLDACRRDARPTRVGKPNDGRHGEKRKSEHYEENEIAAVTDVPVVEASA